jgi:16S rRNA (guanine966-N2)-methyltransferase
VRIISGKYKSRQLTPPANLPVRPTTDFAKTGLFNMLENRFDITDFSCLDLFAGTGSISFELASRGCRQVTSVDKEAACIYFIKDSAKKLGIENISTYKMDALLFLKKTTGNYDLIFADPPFSIPVRDELHEIIFNTNVLNTNGVFIMEHSSRESFEQLAHFRFNRKYGNVAFSFFSKLDLT